MRSRIDHFMAVILAALLLTVSVQADDGFEDVYDSAPYAKAVEYVSEAGIMNGGSGRKFNPDNTVTRAQMAAIVCRMVGEYSVSSTGKTPFRDIPISYWANGYIQKAMSLGIISGFADGTFRPENPLNFNQGVTMLIRAAGLKEAAEKAGGYPSGYLTVARQYNFLAGINAQKKTDLKRYEIAMMIYNYYEGTSGAAEDVSHIPSCPLADGEYDRMRISPEGTNTDQNGNERISAKLMGAVMFDDSYVRSWKIGDKISLKKYGLDDEIIVTKSIGELVDGTYINDEMDLWREGDVWKIFDHDIPIEYFIKEVNLELSEETVIIDGYTSIAETGNPGDKKLRNLREFFERNGGEWAVNITIVGGEVTRIYIPYVPVDIG